jgi:hypothetical protein
MLRRRLFLLALLLVTIAASSFLVARTDVFVYVVGGVIGYLWGCAIVLAMWPWIKPR